MIDNGHMFDKDLAEAIRSADQIITFFRWELFAFLIVLLVALLAWGRWLERREARKERR